MNHCIVVFLELPEGLPGSGRESQMGGGAEMGALRVLLTPIRAALP